MNGYFFDMDGTLYNNRFHEVSEKTFKMLNELQSQGHFVALSTSRCQSEERINAPGSRMDVWNG